MVSITLIFVDNVERLVKHLPFCYFALMDSCNNTNQIILASASPRREYLLRQAGLSFTVEPSKFDETTVSISSPTLFSQTLAEKKAKEVAEKHPDGWVIGADTIVVIDDLILGKPDTRQHAREMLHRLSGQTHCVITGYCICCHRKNKFISETIQTDVEFKQLSAEEIEWYIHTSEPFDKAGAYAIQGLGTFLVRRIHGSYTNVVGLPVCEVIECLIREGVIGFNTQNETCIRENKEQSF